MINDSHFEKVMLNELWVDQTTLSVSKSSIKHVSGHCMDLAKQLAIDFGIFLSEHHVARRGGIWVSNDGVISTTEQLFELYLTENK